jgi:prepilin-type processing-associated H-X9-DG protein
MDENLVGYLLGSLDPETHREVEAYLAASPEAQAKLGLLRQALAPLAADKDAVEPPPDLALRAIITVAEHVVASGRGVANAPGESPVADFLRSLRRKPVVPPPVFPWHGNEAEPVQYGRRNLIATVGLTVALLLVGVTAVVAMRQTREVLACQNNMRVWNLGLNTYCDQHENRLPQVPPGEEARSAWRMLQDAGAIPPEAATVCPGTGRSRTGDPEIDYAYTLGYRDAAGTLHGFTRGGENDQLPIFADAPERKGGEAFPLNHRKGQNVLFAGGHVRFCTNPFVGPEVGGRGDDIYFNTAREPHAGTERWDVVLGKANDQP